jgi:bacterioferritin
MPGRMDKSEFIEKLNEDLGTQFQPVVRYVQHTASIKAAGYGPIVDELGKSSWPRA